MSEFIKFVYTPAGSVDATLAIAASRSGGIGIFNAEFLDDVDLFLEKLGFLSKNSKYSFGIKLDIVDNRLLDAVLSYSQAGLQWLIIDAEILLSCKKTIIKLRKEGVQVVAELKTLHWPTETIQDIVDGLVLKGNESGGFVGEYSSFILLQKWLQETSLPLYIRGGVTPYVAASCHALGGAGVVLDSQVLLLEESPLSQDMGSLLENLSGNETVAVGNGEKGNYFRLLVRPRLLKTQEFCARAECNNFKELRALVYGKIDWREPDKGLLPVGQDICFAGPWRKQYGHMAALFKAIDTIIEDSLPQAVKDKPFSRNAPLARFLGTDLPIVQGPMARVSDCFEFAEAVSREGGLPMLALSLQKGDSLDKLLSETQKAIGSKPWGIGVLGFAPQALLDQQLVHILKYNPQFAIIAGGRPDQAVKFQQAGITSFLHVPSSSLIPLFLQQGARGFIFEGRECGGHVGPLSSFVLWSSMVDRLLSELGKGTIRGDEVQVLFAGGIHDAVSSALVQVLAAPLTKQGVKVGIIMGSGYIFTKEIVDCRAILPTFQRVALACNQTVNLESGPGHASRCAYTPFAKEYFNKSKQLRQKKVPVDESREFLDDLIMGRLRIATKGYARTGNKSELKQLNEHQQQSEGMFMLGQLATLRREVIDIFTLHHEVTEKATALLSARLSEVTHQKPCAAAPVDVAIIGLASLLPGADTTQEYWDNILYKIQSVSEIPSSRWDWELYYDKDRQAKDKSYSKWGGFLKDVAFDPTRYGMPPKSVESVDPMQLMALEVAHRTLADAGYDHKNFDRERTSVIIGASGGAGDVGVQYGLRAELPRFLGEDLPPEVAGRLPEWTEDSFPGILLNVIAGRIANRLNLGGVNFTTDAACASSLAAVYQGVAELDSRRSDFVLAGGVDTVQGPFGYMCFSKTQALSPRGQCNTFDAAADGIVISEGLAMVALKRLDDAERDGDRIYAIIKGIGGGSDGKAKGLSAPAPAGQLRAMQRAYHQAGFGPETVDLFEAHGTGTVAGDTAELESTTELIKQAGGAAHQAVIGSVKTLIGHTKATAGIAGMVKAALALHHRVLPPHSGVTQPNHVLRDDTCPLFLLNEPRPWLRKTNGSPRRAATSAFGFGGSNFHVVLEEYTREYRPWISTSASQRWPAELFVWSANDKKSLSEKLLQAQQDFRNIRNIELRDLAFNVVNAWRADDEVMAIVACNFNDLTAKIENALSYLAGKRAELPPNIYHNNIPVKEKIAVLFPGQGSQYIEMLRELACNFPICSETLSQADEFLREAFKIRFGKGTSLSHFIFPRGVYDQQQKEAAVNALNRTDVAQSALGAVEAGYWKLMQEFGLKADMLAGHSYGEYVALFSGGYIDFETLMLLSKARGRSIIDAAQAKGTELGTMAAVMAKRVDVEKIIQGIDNVVVANHNGPNQSIISGSKSAIKEAIEITSKAGIKIKELQVAAAFHSPFVDGAQDGLVEAIKLGRWQIGAIPVYSNTTAEVHGNDIKKIKEQMVEHLAKPVEFMAEIEAMYRDGARIFLELGPKSVLSRMVADILNGRPHMAISIEGDGNGIKGMLCCFGQLLSAGVNIDVKKLFDGRDCLNGKLSTIQRGEPVSQHTWMLNGSGARRASDPVKQIGVKKGEGGARVKLDPIDSPLPVSTGNNPVVAYKQFIPLKTRKEALRMERKRQEPAIEDSTIMDKYFDTMHRFLDTQENVMSIYFGTPAPERSSVRITTRQERARARMVGWQHQKQIQQQTEVPVQSPNIADETKADLQILPPATPVKEKMGSRSYPDRVECQSDISPKPLYEKNKEEFFSQEQIMEMLLSIVEEKTGYPKGMIGFEQNLEADLGIDSIKRVEIVGAVLQALPEKYGQLLGAEGRAGLNTQATLHGMLDLLGSLNVEKETARPFDKAGTEEVTSNQGYPFRHILSAQEDLINDAAQARLRQGHYLITQDKAGVSPIFTKALVERGCTVRLIERNLLLDPTSLHELCASLRYENTLIAGVVHLAPLGSDWLDLKSRLADWKKQIQLNEKSLFILLHNLSDMLADDAHILSASGLGGFFCREPGSFSCLSLQGGSSGLLKSLNEERPELRVKAIDIDLEQSPHAISESLFKELELVGGRLEVGYPHGKRTIFRTIPDPVDVKKIGTIENAIILATGGLRGITAEALRTLASPGNTFLVIGRSKLPESESFDLQSFSTQDELKKYFITKVQNGDLAMTPAEIKKRVTSIVAAREMRNNMKDFSRKGAVVEYHSVDVTNEEEISKLFGEIYKRYGKIDGVIHGAGVIEDKLLADKTEESWSRVVETKVIGLLLLQKYIKPELLSFFTVFSSVAGRYGNSGQTDYATANELMSRICCQLRASWPAKVNVRSFCWGPWGKTKFGDGMVTADTEAKFAEKGVTLVTPETGCPVLRFELTSGNASPVEIICGKGPWEQFETARGSIKKRALREAERMGPLLGVAILETRPKGDQILRFNLDHNHIYLQDHRIDGTPVLPAAVALEIMAEAATSLWPGWLVVEVLDCRLLKGIELKDNNKNLIITINPPPYGSSDGFEVTAFIQSQQEDGDQRTHYRAVLRLEQHLSHIHPMQPQIHTEKQLAISKAYNELLFHGPKFQVIENIVGLSAQGATAMVRSTCPSEWLKDTGNCSDQWIFDPAVIDVAAQMAILWSRTFRNETSLPVSFGRVVRHTDSLPDKLHMHFELIETKEPHLICANAIFCNSDKEVLLVIEGMECVSSEALNRLGGTAASASTTVM